MIKSLSLFILTLFSLTLPLWADTSSPESIRLFTKFISKGHRLVIQTDHGPAMPGTFISPKVEQMAKSLGPGDEALIVGYLTYENSSIQEGSFTPAFMITEIHLVSLKKLGLVNDKPIDDPATPISEKIYAPQGFHLSSEATTAMILTASVLLIQNLSYTENTPKTNQDLNKMLIFSTGALATGVFIYEQLIKKKDSP